MYPTVVVYKPHGLMLELKQTEVFRRWRTKLKDERVRGMIAARLDRLAFGHVGDVKFIGDGVSELRIDFGPGYRIYFHKRGRALILLLCAGDKSTQPKDIQTAKRLARDWKETDA